jgi:hypothetical protein
MIHPCFVVATSIMRVAFTNGLIGMLIVHYVGLKKVIRLLGRCVAYCAQLVMLITEILTMVWPRFVPEDPMPRKLLAMIA